MTEEEISTVVDRHSAEWIRSAAAFARVIDSRGIAADATLHVVDAATLPPASRSVVGWTAPGAERIFRAAGLLRDSRPGPVVVLDCERIARSVLDAQDVEAETADAVFSLATRRVLLHELGHVAEIAATGAAAVAATLPLLLAAAASPRAEEVEDRHHGGAWIRGYLHAASRAVSICWPREWWRTSAEADVAGYLAATPAEVADLSAALAREAEETADEPLADVLRRDPPPAFSDLVDRLTARRRETRLATLRSRLMATTFESLRQRSQDRADHALDVLAKAARDQSAGVEVDVAAIDSALHDLRLDVADYAAMVETATRRRDALAALEKLAAARNRREKVKATIAVESERIDAAVVAFHERAAALQEQLREAEAVVAAAEAGRRVLLDAATVPGSAGRRYREAVAARQEATDRVEALDRAIRDVEEEIGRHERWIRDVARIEPASVDPSRWVASPGVPQWQADGHDGELDRHHRYRLRAIRRRDELTTEAEPARRSLTEANREADAAEAAALKA